MLLYAWVTARPDGGLAPATTVSGMALTSQITPAPTGAATPAAPATPATPVNLAPSDQPLAQQPSPVATGQAPGPLATGQVPQAVQTPGVATGTNNNQTQPPAQNPQASAPTTTLWLFLVLLGIALLAALGFLLLRRRAVAEARASAETLYAPVAPPSQLDGGVGTTTTTTTGTTTTSTTTATTGAPTGSGTATTMAGPAAPLPQTIQCPNCGTANNFNENFCHECGQDLRPTRAQIIAAATPPEETISEDTPYLETLDRVDEQLEYVLSRPVVTIGTAPDNDIVIDSAFQGWQTVSPVHAELRLEQDGFMLIDRESAAGTFVNEMRTGENLLKDGDLIRLGDVRFIFHVPRPE